MNMILEREKSGYRLLDGVVVEITDTNQLEEIQTASAPSRDFDMPAKHIRAALTLYADRKNPDYRNSIKESISAVEAAAKIFSAKRER